MTADEIHAQLEKLYAEAKAADLTFIGLVADKDEFKSAIYGTSDKVARTIISALPSVELKKLVGRYVIQEL